jgi:hypothetical protein
VGHKLNLWREATNKHDSNAIRVHHKTGQVGYLPAAVAVELAPFLDSGCIAEVTVSSINPSKPYRSVTVDYTIRKPTDDERKGAGFGSGFGGCVAVGIFAGWILGGITQSGGVFFGVIAVSAVVGIFVGMKTMGNVDLGKDPLDGIDTKIAASRTAYNAYSAKKAQASTGRGSSFGRGSSSWDDDNYYDPSEWSDGSDD